MKIINNHVIKLFSHTPIILMIGLVNEINIVNKKKNVVRLF